ncbi:MAG: phosphodiester glycosidase family protein [Ignavibacteriales bacterium]
MRKSTIVLIVLDVLALIGFFLTYGPINYFRNLLITTAMNTMTHQYFAYIFYTDEMISKVLSKNYFVKIDEDINLDDIVIDTDPKDHYDNEYDEAILERTPGNDDYKIINIKIGNSTGYLVAIYDPSKVKTISQEKLGTENGERILTMCQREGGLVCINGGGFKDPEGTGSGIPLGPVIKEGKIIWDDGVTSELIGFNEDDKLVLVKSNAQDALNKYKLRDALQFGPFLIVNGKPMEIVGDPWGYAPRVAIAQRKDGIVLFLVADGENYTNGATLKNMIDVLLKYGAHNAANLDGGHSTTLIVKGQLYNNPPALAKKQGGRYVVNGFGLIP